jgi:hypothetical protein
MKIDAGIHVMMKLRTGIKSILEPEALCIGSLDGWRDIEETRVVR